MSCAECKDTGVVRRYIGHEGRGATFACNCQSTIWVKVYRMQKMGVGFVHSCIGYMEVAKENPNVCALARELFANGPDDKIEVGYFFRAWRSKEVEPLSGAVRIPFLETMTRRVESA